jgi:thiol-disulfide isomerase/thioredoxin
MTMEKIELINSLSTLVKDGNIDQAVKNSIKLGKEAAFMIDANFALGVTLEVSEFDPEWPEKCRRYFRALSKENDPEIEKLIWPVISWLDISEASSDKEKIRMVREFQEKLPPDSLDWKAADVFSFLILRDLDKNKLDKRSAWKVLFDRVQAYLLERYRIHPKDNRTRYFLSYSWYYLSEKNPGKTGEFLCKAADVSPDPGSDDYFYDMHKLDPILQQKGFRRNYYEYLTGLGQKDKALPVLETITVLEPTDANLNEFKGLYEQVYPDRKTDFLKHWHQAISSACEDLPAVSFTNDKGEEVVLWTQTGKWTYIDIWGTWCRPCVAEIPELQELYAENLKNPDSPLAIVTWAHDKPELMDTFMKEKGYTFPVILIPRNIEKAFKISSFPTKFLITPDGKYLKIPFNSDWKQYLRNYIGTN